MLIPSLYDAARVWNLLNLDTFELMRGQFHAEELTHSGVGSAYAEKWALNRKNPIMQFLRGESETYTFTGRFHATTMIEDAEVQLELLKEWARRNESFARPNVLEFWAGNGHAFFTQCVIQSLGDIRYDRPTAFGAVRHVTFNMTLLQYHEYSLEGPSIGDTRYHRVRQGDYYELICWREYRNPKFGDVIRKRHPLHPSPQIGDTIKLPHISKIRKERVTQTSYPLAGAFERKDTPQRALRLEWLEKHSDARVSHVLKV